MRSAIFNVLAVAGTVYAVDPPAYGASSSAEQYPGAVTQIADGQIQAPTGSYNLPSASTSVVVKTSAIETTLVATTPVATTPVEANPVATTPVGTTSAVNAPPAYSSVEASSLTEAAPVTIASSVPVPVVPATSAPAVYTSVSVAIPPQAVGVNSTVPYPTGRNSTTLATSAATITSTINTASSTEAGAVGGSTSPAAATQTGAAAAIQFSVGFAAVAGLFAFIA